MPAPTREERENREQEFRAQCLLVWGILVGRATGAGPGGAGAIAYNQLATRAGIGGDGQGWFQRLVKILDAIYCFCRHHEPGLPPLVVLAVNARHGEPGESYRGTDIAADTEQVLAYPWLQVPDPQPEDF